MSYAFGRKLANYSPFYLVRLLAMVDQNHELLSRFLDHDPPSIECLDDREPWSSGYGDWENARYRLLISWNSWASLIFVPGPVMVGPYNTHVWHITIWVVDLWANFIGPWAGWRLILWSNFKRIGPRFWAVILGISLNLGLTSLFAYCLNRLSLRLWILN